MPVAVAVVPQSPIDMGLPAHQKTRSVADMQAFLARLNPQSPSESLRLLRNAYPDAPLSLRVAACGIGGR